MGRYWALFELLALPWNTIVWKLAHIFVAIKRYRIRAQLEVRLVAATGRCSPLRTLRRHGNSKHILHADRGSMLFAAVEGEHSNEHRITRGCDETTFWGSRGLGAAAALSGTHGVG